MTERLTDEQFDEIDASIHYLHRREVAFEDLDKQTQTWIGPDGGTLSLLNELAAERERADRLAAELHDMRRKVALVRGMHFQYRAPAEDRFDCCAECNRVSRGYVPWPCATYKAVTGDES